MLLRTVESGTDDEAAFVGRCRRIGRRRGRGEKDAARFHARVVARQRVERRRVQHRPGPDAERRLVPRADDPVAIADALGQRPAGMGAGRAYRAHGAAVPQQQDFLAVHLDLHHAAWL